MKQSPRLFNALRLAGLMAIVILGLVSIIGTGGGGGGSSSSGDDRTYYRDIDGDGYGDPNDSAEFSSLPIGYYVTGNTDCDDTDEAVNPGVPEICDDDIDNDCDGRIDVDCTLTCTDTDGDGYYAESECRGARDCDDTNAAICPGAVEICWDDIDNNCDGRIDEDCVCVDTDRDGYYVRSGCGTAVDCNDVNAAIHPGAVEACGDGIDNNCDGRIDEVCGIGPALVPDTGQIICYDDAGRIIACPAPGKPFHGQDACYTINPPSYAKMRENGGAMVSDNVTGLIWEVKTDDGGIHDKDDRYTWNNVNDVFLARLNADQFGGYSDWRLPTKKELISIVNFGTYQPAIDRAYFPNTRSSYYWSSPTSADNPGGSSRVSFLFGQDYDPDESGLCYVRAVRGGETLLPSFTDNGDGTVTDNATGLVWAQATAATTMTWKAALAWCENLSLAGYEDWRLPTLKELGSIVVDDAADNGTYFPDTVSSYYWSSTAYAYNPGHAWLVNLNYGNNGHGSKASAYNVRAVRGGQGSIF